MLHCLKDLSQLGGSKTLLTVGRSREGLSMSIASTAFVVTEFCLVFLSTGFYGRRSAYGHEAFEWT